MQNTEVLIVGAGPAGATCAWKLKQHKVDFLLLDKTFFPRFKPCAGWVTPRVLQDLEITPGEYPGGLTHFTRFEISIRNFHFTMRTNQYAIRRFELDHWLAQRATPNLVNHEVREIVHKNGRFFVDGAYSAKHLIGAGGTHCPVASTFFREDPANARGSLIVAQEEEFQYEYSDPRCHLWFLQNGLPGYAWYVPKDNGFVNIGVGGSAADLKGNGDTLKRHWNLLVEKLDQEGLVRGGSRKPVGHSYYLRGKNTTAQNENAYLTGDAVGLATRDMGEGIGPALQSGLRAAEAIIFGKEYSLASIQKYSFPSLLGLRR